MCGWHSIHNDDDGGGDYSERFAALAAHSQALWHMPADRVHSWALCVFVCSERWCYYVDNQTEYDFDVRLISWNMAQPMR